MTEKLKQLLKFCILVRFEKAQKAAFSPEATLPLGQTGRTQEGLAHVGYVNTSCASSVLYFTKDLLFLFLDLLVLMCT